MYLRGISMHKLFLGGQAGARRAVMKLVSAHRGVMKFASVAPAALVLAAGFPAAAQALHPSLTTLWSFSGPDGATPYGGVVRDRAGNLYGVTSVGGANNMGRAFELSPPPRTGKTWSMTPVWDFSGPDGNYSQTTLLRDGAGDLYGVMVLGGAANDGVVFRLVPPASGGQAWTEQTLWSFSGTDGAYPFNGVTMDKAGQLYGTTLDGGSSNIGAVFRLTPGGNGQPWTETTMWSFAGPEGQSPISVPVVTAQGMVYGTAQYGGPNNNGTVYKLVPTGNGAWSAAVLSDFNGGSGDGMTPYASPLRVGNDGYAATVAGGPTNSGTVFEVSPDRNSPTGWRRKTIWNFSGSDGCCVYGKLLADAAGSLYGTTGFAGTANGGTVFKLRPPADRKGKWTETVLWQFTGGADGGNPGDGLIADQKGVLYGTTSAGGGSKLGTVFMITGAGFAVK